MGEVQHLCAEIENSALIADFGRWEVERVPGADVQGEARRNLPVVADKELSNVRTRLNDLFLDVDGERVHLPEK